MRIAILSNMSTHIDFEGSVSLRTRELCKLLLNNDHQVWLCCKDPNSLDITGRKGKMPEFINKDSILFFNEDIEWNQRAYDMIMQITPLVDIIHSCNILFNVESYGPLDVPVFMDLNYPSHLKKIKNLYPLALCQDFYDYYSPLVYKQYTPLYLFDSLRRSRRLSSTQNLLWLGRICKDKDPILAIELAKALNVNTIFAGIEDNNDATYVAEFKKRISESKYCTFLGAVFGNQKEKLLLSSKALIYTCSSTWQEASGTIFFEAMSAGLPVLVLTSKVNAANNYILEGRNGYLSNDFNSLKKLCAQISTISPETCKESYDNLIDPDLVYSNLISIYQSILHGEA